MKWRLASDVPDEEVRLLLTVARRRRFARGEVVFHKDDPADSLHLIATGHFVVRLITPLGDDRSPSRGSASANTSGEMAPSSAEASNARAATVQALRAVGNLAVFQGRFHAAGEMTN